MLGEVLHGARQARERDRQLEAHEAQERDEDAKREAGGREAQALDLGTTSSSVGAPITPARETVSQPRPYRIESIRRRTSTTVDSMSRVAPSMMMMAWALTG